MGAVPHDPKRCTSCGDHKPRAEFYPHSKAPRGVSAWCKVCTNARSTAARKADNTSSKLATKRYQTKKKYGLTLEAYDELLASQGGCCAICGAEKAGGRGRFHVDHCHATGKIRGLLCHGCNIGLGSFRDDAAVMRRAADYLEREDHVVRG